ncbi:hypothetical protein FZC78_04260 [Rossellomorea vietnamensis]|uniref:Uncharacterized protein n=1 Tax=Rossellomorea vietnamensis TaxID=218284 RepID=A0A5D4NWK8_9BACI|nr:DUF6501 family protein [Rossellomorea vietnamensis]TYS18733.1 hypothetical protein FZC78_04260 [Rossellomorea vietnamensis]
MIHRDWTNRPSIKTVKCKHTNAAKYKVENVLTPGKTYEVKNESEDYLFVVDDSGKMGGFYKDYFEEAK